MVTNRVVLLYMGVNKIKIQKHKIMKKALFILAITLCTSLVTKAQSYYYKTSTPSYSTSSYSTPSYNVVSSSSVYSGGYSSNQTYSSGRGYTNVNTTRNYDNYGGGYSSSTNVYKNGSLSSFSYTTSNSGVTNTYKYKY